jgi:hypothetical protein
VAVFSLRRFYDGPVTTFLARDPAGIRLRGQLEQLGSDVVFGDRISKSWDRHRLFLESPYRSTLVLDSDLLFQAPIDDLWAPLEREGVLATRMFPPLYGVDGSPDRPRGSLYRMGLMEQLRDLVDGDTYSTAVRRLVDDRIDINVGVMGVSRPKGDVFLNEWSELMERRRHDGILLLDELLVVVLLPRHRHFLADEAWNCPADEFFRRTNLADARVIHYFGDGHIVDGTRLGRNPATWAGRKWYKVYREAAKQIDLRHWESRDPTFVGKHRPGFQIRAARALRQVIGKTAGPGDGKSWNIRRLWQPFLRAR